MRKATTKRKELASKALRASSKAAPDDFAGHHVAKGTETSTLFERTYADAQAYDDMERDFEKVIAELGSDSRLETLRSNFEKILTAVRRSHDNEKRLASKCKQLNEDLSGASARVTAAMRLSEEDQLTITALRKELDKHWKQIDAAHDKESKLRSELADMRLQLEDMTKQAEENKEHDAAFDDLLKQKQELVQERDNQVTEIAAMRREDEQLREQLKAAEQQLTDTETTLESVRLDAAAKKAEQERDVKKREKMEKEVHDLKMSLDARLVELRNRSAEIQTAGNTLKDYEQQIRALHVAQNHAKKECNELINEEARLSRNLSTQVANCQRLASDNQVSGAALKSTEAALAAAKAENGRLSRAADSWAAKLRLAEEKRTSLEQNVEEQRMKHSALEKERQAQIQQIALLESKLSVMQHEQDLVVKLKNQALGSSHHQMDLTKLHEGHIRVLEGQLAAHKQAMGQATLKEAALVREREAAASEAKQLSGKLAQAQQQLELRKKEKKDAQELLEEKAAAVSAQQKSLEHLRSEKNAITRDCSTAQAESSEARSKLDMLNRELEEVRAELKAKDTALLNEKAIHTKADGERQGLLAEVARVQQCIANSNQEAVAAQKEIDNMQTAISLAGQERSQQLRDFKSLLAERDKIGAQLIKQNEHVAAQQDKIRLQESAMRANEAAYKDSLSELRLVKASVRKLQGEHSAAKRRAITYEALQQEVIVLEKQLLREQNKTKALSDELETPLNVHRWRKLEGSDPATFELLQKVQLLHRRLIRTGELVVERDLQIQDKEHLCQELQALLQRSPGPEAARKLLLTQEELKDKMKSLHAMKAELDMRHAQVDDYKFNIKQMQAEINALKGHFFDKKREFVMGVKSLSPINTVQVEEVVCPGIESSAISAM